VNQELRLECKEKDAKWIDEYDIIHYMQQEGGRKMRRSLESDRDRTQLPPPNDDNDEITTCDASEKTRRGNRHETEVTLGERIREKTHGGPFQASSKLCQRLIGSIPHELVEAADDDLDAHDYSVTLALLNEVHPSGYLVGMEPQQGRAKATSRALAAGVMRGEEELADRSLVQDCRDLKGSGW